MIYERKQIDWRGTGWYTTPDGYRLICAHPENKRLCISVGMIDPTMRETDPKTFHDLKVWMEHLYRTGKDLAA